MRIFLARNLCVTWHDQEGAVLKLSYAAIADMDIQE